MVITLLHIISTYTLPLILLTIPLYALARGVKVYQVFLEGAREGLTTAVGILPSLVCMLCAIGIFRSSGAMDGLIALLTPITNFFHIPSEIFTLGVVRTFSGSAAQGLLADILTTYGADSLLGNMASVVSGSSETTFYVIGVYFGSVGITRIRHGLAAGLLADVVTLAIATWISFLVWG